MASAKRLLFAGRSDCCWRFWPSLARSTARPRTICSDLNEPYPRPLVVFGGHRQARGNDLGRGGAEDGCALAHLLAQSGRRGHRHHHCLDTASRGDAGAIEWPVPKKSVTSAGATSLYTYGYDGKVVLLIPLAVANSAPPGPVRLAPRSSGLSAKTRGSVCLPDRLWKASSKSALRTSLPATPP